jgi:NAD(P)-dependent dehydrogenase (short-subunit alcohol dehydrogenase family)
MKFYTLITGATSGIGLKTVLELSPKHNLLVVGRSKKKLEHLKKSIGDEHLYFYCDLLDVDNIENNLSLYLKNNNALINKFISCAGVDQNTPAKSLNSRSVNEMMKINFYSVIEIVSVLMKFSVNKASLKNIIFVSSISSIRGFKGKGAYSASKGALDSYMRVISKEFAPRVVVNSVLPGAVHTPMSESTFQNADIVSHLNNIYPMGVGSVDKVVDCIKFYHDLENSWITGQQFVVDGGLTS